jgi:prepilin-type N-terminal cleavage/methylation domain-containing protein
MKFLNKHNSFTLIELLVVVAIIGILSSVVIVNITSARNKAKDNAIKANLNQMVKAGELWLSDHTDYSGFCSNNNCAAGGTDWRNICLGIKSQNGNTTVTCNINPTNDAWCASSNLATSGRSYCVDSKATFKDNAFCDQNFVCH